MKLGDKIRQLREECGLTQGQLAASSSVSQGYLSQLENGEVKNPSAAVLLRVAQAMHVDSDELFEARDTRPCGRCARLPGIPGHGR
jgi:transcriptional regulator with XRE-family HTH domain